jgi:hypothetical protein
LNALNTEKSNGYRMHMMILSAASAHAHIQVH